MDESIDFRTIIVNVERQTNQDKFLSKGLTKNRNEVDKRPGQLLLQIVQS